MINIARIGRGRRDSFNAEKFLADEAKKLEEIARKELKGEKGKEGVSGKDGKKVVQKIITGGATTIPEFRGTKVKNEDYTLLTSDGTNTYVKIALDSIGGQPFILDSRDDDALAMTVNDDLSGLLLFNGFIQGREETL